jgi:sortase A
MRGLGMRSVLLAFGECCVTAGVVVVLFLAYLLWGTALQTSQHQHAFASQLEREWQTDGGTKPVTAHMHLVTGKPFAFIRIPRFGRKWRFAIVQGTDLPQLALGPGHVPGTALPGQIGNFAVAAHRVTAGNPFYHLNDLRPGDEVLIDTSVTTYVYRVTKSELVLPDDTAILDPVPGYPRQRPREAMITLITCDPPWTGTHRIIVLGSLQAEVPRTGHTSASAGEAS